MATRPLTNAEVLPALEPLELEHRGSIALQRLRPLASWTRGALHDLAGQSIRLWAFSAFYLSAGRIALDWAQLTARRQGDVAKPTLIVGAGRVGRLTARRLQEHPEFGLRPVGFLDKEPLGTS